MPLGLLRLVTAVPAVVLGVRLGWVEVTMVNVEPHLLSLITSILYHAAAAVTRTLPRQTFHLLRPEHSATLSSQCPALSYPQLACHQARAYLLYGQPALPSEVIHPLLHHLRLLLLI